MYYVREPFACVFGLMRHLPQWTNDQRSSLRTPAPPLCAVNESLELIPCRAVECEPLAQRTRKRLAFPARYGARARGEATHPGGVRGGGRDDASDGKVLQ